jgi:hypothetical protein
MAEQDEAPIDLASARAALDELFTLAKKYNGSDAYLRDRLRHGDVTGRHRRCID